MLEAEQDVSVWLGSDVNRWEVHRTYDILNVESWFHPDTETHNILFFQQAVEVQRGVKLCHESGYTVVIELFKAMCHLIKAAFNHQLKTTMFSL